MQFDLYSYQQSAFMHFHVDVLQNLVLFTVCCLLFTLCFEEVQEVCFDLLFSHKHTSLKTQHSNKETK